MDGQGQFRKEQLAETLEAEYRAYMGRVMEAVNAAPDGRWIEASEVRVNELMNQFKERVFEAALQARVEVSEITAAKAPAAFSPSGRRAGA
jgi:hypothetical protein